METAADGIGLLLQAFKRRQEQREIVLGDAPRTSVLDRNKLLFVDPPTDLPRRELGVFSDLLNRQKLGQRVRRQII
jgi:hypothetical protein